MSKCDERTAGEVERDKRIRGLELRMEGLFSRVSEEVALKAIEMGAEIANQFAAARQGEMQELTERVADLETFTGSLSCEKRSSNGTGCAQWTGPVGAEEVCATCSGSDWPRDGYEDPGPASISPLG